MRKTSVSAQLTRTARRFSAVIAPQLTKIETVGILQKHNKIIIQIADVTQVREAIKQFVFYGYKNFDPVEFHVRSVNDLLKTNCKTTDSCTILIAQFYAEEIVLFEGNKRLLSICLNESLTSYDKNFSSTNEISYNNNGQNFGSSLAKVRHPISGIKIFEFIESTPSKKSNICWTIQGTMDELNKCTIEAQTNCLKKVFSVCGCSFSTNLWNIQHEGVQMGQAQLQNSLWQEKSMRVEWTDKANNQLRLLTLCFGIIQIIRVGYPSLMHIVDKSQKNKFTNPN